MMRILQTLRRRMNGEGGFTLVEAMISITILAVGASPSPRRRCSAWAAPACPSAAGLACGRRPADGRGPALNYDNLVLSDTSTLTHSADPNNPDYWVNATAQTYDPDGSGPLAAEPIVRVAGALLRCQHYQNPLLDGGTTYEVYRTSPGWTRRRTERAPATPPTGTMTASATPTATTPSASPSSSSGRELGPRRATSLSESSLFSDGQIIYKAPTHNVAPDGVCARPRAWTTRPSTFTANASDSDGTIASVSWNFGDGATGTGTSVDAHVRELRDLHGDEHRGRQRGLRPRTTTRRAAR